VAQPLQPAGFYWSGFLCLVLAVFKLTMQARWSRWRALLPFSAVVGHNILYITVGLVWLYLVDHGTAEEDDPPRVWWVRLPTRGAGLLCHFRG
jgi:hypothetical protein